jgi:hypothetical protein
MYEGMGHSFAQLTPDAKVPAAQRAAADLSQTRAFEFLQRELGGTADATPVAGKASAEETSAAG